MRILLDTLFMSQSHGLGKGLSSLIPRKNAPGEATPSSGGVSAASTPATPQSSIKSPLSASPFGAGSYPLKSAPLADEAAPEPVLPTSGDVAVSDVHASSESSVSYKKNIGEAFMVPIGSIVPNPHQPRIQFSEEKLLELAQSIREHGILQPLIVTRIGETYELIAGERRLQAAKIVGLAEVPVVVRKAEEQQKFEFAIIENIQRHDLNPIEEARAYDRLSKEFQLSQEDIAKKMGRSRSAIANTLRLLQLPVEIQRAVATDKISEGHAKALLSIENSEKQRALFDLIVRNSLTVREAEMRSREFSTKSPRKGVSKDPELEAKERKLSEVFGTKVRIAKTGNGGMIRIDYFSDEEFTGIFSKLSGEGGKIQN